MTRARTPAITALVDALAALFGYPPTMGPAVRRRLGG
jgi:hypothetical protein